jgi:hypothetical protein
MTFLRDLLLSWILFHLLTLFTNVEDDKEET